MKKVATVENATPILLVCLCLAIYGATLAPAQLGGDAGELQLVPAILSLAHPTGYPLQSLLGKLWVSLIPMGSVAWRMNLFSACAGALCIGLLCQTVHRITHSWLASTVAALSLAVSPIFWGQAVLADKYVLNATLLTAVLWAVTREIAHPGMSAARLTAFLYGLSLTHHRSMLVFGPLLLAHWLWRYRGEWRNGRLWLGILLMASLPLCLYVYLPFAEQRGLPPNLWHPKSLSDWLVYLSDQQFVAAVRPDQTLFSNLQFFGRTLRDQFGWLGLALGGLGWTYQYIKRRWLAVWLLVGFCGVAVLTSSYQVFRNWVFFIPAFILFSIWLGQGVCVFKPTWSQRPSRFMRPSRFIFTIVVGFSVIAPSFAHTYPQLRSEALDGGPIDLYRNDLKHGYQAQRFVQNSLPWVLPNSWILVDWEQATPLWYAQQIDGLRPDVSVFFPLELLSKELIAHRAVYIGRTYPSLGDAYHYSAHGALLRVTEAGEFDMPTKVQFAPAVWDDTIELVGYRTYQTNLRMGRVLPLSLFFRAARRSAVNYAISIRLFDTAGNPVAQEDRDAFALGMAASSRWAQGEVVGDYFELPVPQLDIAENQRPTQYQVGILLYEKMPDGQLRNATLAKDGTVLHRLPALTLGDN